MAFNPNSNVTVSVTVANQGFTDSAPIMNRVVLNALFKASQVLYDGALTLLSAQTFLPTNAGVVFVRHAGTTGNFLAQVYDGQLAGAATYTMYPGSMILFFSTAIFNPNQDGVNKVI